MPKNFLWFIVGVAVATGTASHADTSWVAVRFKSDEDLLEKVSHLTPCQYDAKRIVIGFDRILEGSDAEMSAALRRNMSVPEHSYMSYPKSCEKAMNVR